MTARKLPQMSHKTPALTTGDDRELTPCQRDVAQRLKKKQQTGVYEPSPFDLLHDHETGHIFEAARKAARAICDTCPVKASCHADNADEIWVGPIRDSPGHPGRYPTAPCGSITAYHRHRSKRETPCQPCKTAWAAYQYDYKRRKNDDTDAA